MNLIDVRGLSPEQLTTYKDQREEYSLHIRTAHEANTKQHKHNADTSGNGMVAEA